MSKPHKHSCGHHCGHDSHVYREVKSVRVPEGGWTQETYEQNAEELTAYFLHIQRMAKTRAMQEIAPPLSKRMRGQVERVLSIVEKKLSSIYGIRKSYDQKENLSLRVEAHQDLWAQAIRQVFNENEDDAIVSIVGRPMREIAVDIHGDTSLALGANVRPASVAVLRTDVDAIARRVTRINDTTRNRLAQTIARAIDEGRPPFEVMQIVRDRIPQIATYRVPTIVRTEMGQAADRAAIRAIRDSGVVTHVSVTGCEAVEPGIPTWNGIPTCNIRNVPVASAGDLRFHINHTGAIVASGFRRENGTRPDLPPRQGRGRGTWEENDRPVPSIIEDPPPLDPDGIDLEVDIDAPSQIVTRQPALVAQADDAVESIRNGLDETPSTLQAVTPTMDEITLPQRRARGWIREIDDEFELSDEDYADMVEAYEMSSNSMADTDLINDFELTQAFIRRTGLAPHEFIDRASASMRAALASVNADMTHASFRLEGRINSTTGQLRAVDLRLRGATVDGELYVHREFNFTSVGSAHVEHHLFAMPHSMQNSGLGKAMLRDLLDLYDQIGIEDITLDANIDVGGYAWARYGFVPRTQSEWIALRTILAERVDDLIDAGLLDVDRLPDEVVDGIAALLESDAPETIRAIAALQLPVGPEGRPLGKALLMNRYWSGRLVLDDPDAYGIFASYIQRR